jgi:hypothetical protein
VQPGSSHETISHTSTASVAQSWLQSLEQQLGMSPPLALQMASASPSTPESQSRGSAAPDMHGEWLQE